MAILALAAPVTYIGSVGGVGNGAPNNLPAAEANAITGNTGFSVPNNGAVLVRVVTGTVVGTFNFTIQRTVEGAVPPAFTPSLSASLPYIFGPFAPADFNDVNGLLQCVWTGFTGGTVGVYVLPPSQYGVVRS